MAEWGYGRCERTLWRRSTPRGELRCVFGHFIHVLSPTSWEEVTVRFWAVHPILAMRQIIASGKNPADFADTEVN